MSRYPLIASIIAVSLLAQDAKDHPTGYRTTPPTINSVAPLGVPRGKTVELTVEGLNLAKAQSVVFNRPGIKGRIAGVKELPDLPDLRLGSNNTPSTIDLGPLPPRNQVTVEVDIDAQADVGPVSFRIQTPLGTSPEARILIEPPYRESSDREPNNGPDNAVETDLPSILVGTIGRAGDQDYFKINVKPGEELVFENGSMQIGSKLQPVIAILAEDLSVVKEMGTDAASSAAQFAHRFENAGTYYVRVTDFQQSGGASHTYRIKAGGFPLVTSMFPLGVPKGKVSDIQLTGFGLKDTNVPVKGELSPGEADLLRVRPAGSFRELTLAIGSDPEILATGAVPQPITLPVTINGKIDKTDGHSFKFRAKKAEKIVFEVAARRFGSELDSYVEVLDASGKPVEIAVARAVMETFCTLRDHDSAGRGIRLTSFTGLAVGDYLMAGNEIMRIEAMPPGPDDDTVMESFGGQRLAFFGTSPESHHSDRPFYKTEVHPAGSRFSSNGLPLVPLYARNDDGGPAYGKDSRLEFQAPSDGEYIVKVRDVRGFHGERFAYRLNVRPPRPDFRLSVNPPNPNVPAGGAIPITVTALRLDGFGGPIEVQVEGMPEGIKPQSAVIKPGQIATTLTIAALPDLKSFDPVPFNVIGRARIGNETIARYADPDDKLKYLALAPGPDIRMTAVTRQVELEPGGTAEIAVEIERLNSFGGRVPVEVRNLPPRVRIIDTGLNGVLINENETKRSFTIEALDTVEPGEQLIWVSGRIETRSPLQTFYASVEPVLVKIKSRASRASAAGRENALQGSNTDTPAK
jgi:hypothetical protein